jgi:hypothetical protein
MATAAPTPKKSAAPAEALTSKLPARMNPGQKVFFWGKAGKLIQDMPPSAEIKLAREEKRVVLRSLLRIEAKS